MIEAQLDRIIALLQSAKDDAAKVDEGRAGAPGTRLRKACQEAKAQLNDLRVAVLETRDAG